MDPAARAREAVLQTQSASRDGMVLDSSVINSSDFRIYCFKVGLQRQAAASSGPEHRVRPGCVATSGLWTLAILLLVPHRFSLVHGDMATIGQLAPFASKFGPTERRWATRACTALDLAAYR